MAGKRSIGNLLKNNFIDATRAELIDAMRDDLPALG